MNKNEIKVALQCCSGVGFETACDDCAYCYRCSDLAKDALSLITEQEKEIDRLRAESKRLTTTMVENGTLIELPCKVGDTVYCVEYFCNYKGCSSDEQMFCCGCPEMIERERRKEKFVISKKKFRLQDLDRVGKTLFPTEEAAKARLKELQEYEK